MLEDFDLHGDRDEDRYEPAPLIYKYASLAEIKLEAELAEQYGKAKSLYASVEADKNTPPNQKAQVLNTVSAVIQAITKSQVDLYNMNKVKALEDALTTALRSLPEPAQQLFYKEYEANLAAIPS